MIKVKLNETVYHVPTAWADITFERYCAIVAAEDATITMRLAAAAGIPPELLDKLPLSSLTSLTEVLAFTDEPNAAYLFAKPYDNKEFNIGKESYSKIEEAKILLTKAEKPIKAAAGIVKIYTGEDITNLPVADCLHKAGFFLAACQHFLSVTSA